LQVEKFPVSSMTETFKGVYIAAVYN
jgi:hypothetical protein